MFEKIRKMKNQKGFTLVELIVVLVILAILAAMLVPALTGYIDKANKEKVVAETRMVVMAAQTEASEQYGKLAANADKKDETIASKLTGTDTSNPCKAIVELSETKGKFKIEVDESGVVRVVTYTNKGFTCVYKSDDASYEVSKADTITANSAIKYTAPTTPSTGNGG